MNFAHFCEFWCFSLGKQARFTLNFCSGMPLRKVHELTFLWFGLPGPLLKLISQELKGACNPVAPPTVFLGCFIRATPRGACPRSLACCKTTAPLSLETGMGSRSKDLRNLEFKSSRGSKSGGVQPSARLSEEISPLRGVLLEASAGVLFEGFWGALRRYAESTGFSEGSDPMLVNLGNCWIEGG